jgi:SAM-dependent methyltransferase
MAGYSEDLAYVHDAGYGDFARGAAPALLTRLRGRGITSGLVVDLGCGSGIWAARLLQAGYDVLGIDISPAMIRLAKKKAPAAKFQVGSLLSADLPRCLAVTALGEVINYTFDPAGSRRSLRPFFRRVYDALHPGGMFVCDSRSRARYRRALGAGLIRSDRTGLCWWMPRKTNAAIH